jgi:hypothetical protein
MPEGTRRSRRGRASLWRAEAEQRVRTALRRYRRPLLGLVARAAYEGETRAFVREFLVEALGFDGEMLERPTDVAGMRADYGLRIKGELVALVEVRRVATRLHAPSNERHGRATAPWLVLTNAVEWHVYHSEAIGGRTGAQAPVMHVDLLGPLALAKKAALLVHLTRESFEHGGTDSLLLVRGALSPDSLSAAVTSVGVLRAIQRELGRKTGQSIDLKAIGEAVRAILSPSPPHS